MSDINKKLLLEEQLDLTKSTDELKSMIEKIKSHLNQLLVDQLHLKSVELEGHSNEIENKTNNIENTNTNVINQPDTYFTIEYINKQDIDLDLLTNNNIKRNNEEVEDDSD